jgi:hypothetical protein
MRRRIPWGSLATFAAVIIALAAVSVALTKIGDDGPPLGVCVVTDPYAFGTDGGGPYAAVRSVTTPVEHDGVTSCPEGQFVPVQAK